MHSNISLDENNYKIGCNENPPTKMKRNVPNLNIKYSRSFQSKTLLLFQQRRKSFKCINLRFHDPKVPAEMLQIM